MNYQADKVDRIDKMDNLIQTTVTQISSQERCDGGMLVADGLLKQRDGQREEG